MQCNAMQEQYSAIYNAVFKGVQCSRQYRLYYSAMHSEMYSAIYSAMFNAVQCNAVIRTRVCKCLGEWPLSFGKSSLLLQEVPSASLYTPFFNIKVILKV